MTVQYECLRKSTTNAAHLNLRKRLEDAISDGRVGVYGVDLEDVQQIDLLLHRHRLGRGELSCIAFAKRTGISVLVDERRGTKLARQVLGADNRAQGTPRLLGWLLFMNHLGLESVDAVIEEHVSAGRPLAHWYREMAEWIRRIKSLRV